MSTNCFDGYAEIACRVGYGLKIGLARGVTLGDDDGLALGLGLTLGEALGSQAPLPQRR
jgi:hypothetical protein